MKKSFVIVVAVGMVAIIGGLLFTFIGSETEVVKDASKVSKKIEVEQNNQTKESSQDSKDAEEVEDMNFKIFVNKEQKDFEDLDSVQRAAVTFANLFYNLEEGMTQEQWAKRLEEKNKEEVSTLANIRDFYIYNTKPRQLVKVILFPEYVTEKHRFILPITVYYKVDGKDSIKKLNLIISRRGDQVGKILGHLDAESVKKWVAQKEIEYDIEFEME